MVSWDIDPTQSFIRLTLPDQSVPVTGFGNVTVRLRDANSTTQWTDAGGRRAFLDGTVQTDYFDGGSIQFFSGAHNIFALQGVNVRPDPADFVGSSYTTTDTAPAAYGAKVRGTTGIFTLDIGFLALRNVMYDIASGVIPLGGGTNIAGSTSNFGFSSWTADFDGLVVLGQQVPDTLNGVLSPAIGLDISAGTITDLGGLNRKLTYNVSVPIAFTASGVPLTGSADGVIVAFATVPEPGTIGMLAIGFVGLVSLARRNRRRSKTS